MDSYRAYYLRLQQIGITSESRGLAFEKAEAASGQAGPEQLFLRSLVYIRCPLDSIGVVLVEYMRRLETKSARLSVKLESGITQA